MHKLITLGMPLHALKATHSGFMLQRAAHMLRLTAMDMRTEHRLIAVTISIFLFDLFKHVY